MNSVVVVESPAKAKTIEGYLGDSYSVIASFGHVRDMEEKDGAVIPGDWTNIKWSLNKRGKQQVDEILSLIRNADRLILATDPDREGEAIAWHICQLLEEKKVLEDKQVFRAVFNSITKSSITESINNLREIDIDRVESYLARRVLDYLVGFNISPLLWRRLPGARSAGRVQSVALKLICEREAEREIFEPQEYWSITGKFLTKSGEVVNANLNSVNKTRLKKFDIPSELRAQEILKEVNSLNFSISEINKKPIKRNPRPPFITSTMQQEAARKLRFSADHTMRVAQTLYEKALITYMRTDSTNVVGEAISEMRQLIKTKYGDDYLPSSPKFYSKKNQQAQEAHEAVRPTQVNITPKESGLRGDELKLYSLIWNRAISSQMESAKLTQTEVFIDSHDKEFTFKANGSQVVFNGFLEVYEEGSDDQQEDDAKEYRLPSSLNINDSLDKEAIETDQHFTKPPARYTEASLIKELEEKGIGRPSTYASIMNSIKKRDYASLENKQFKPASRGRVVVSFLDAYFSDYFKYEFTAEMEESLDYIAKGDQEWTTLLDNFWNGFGPNLEEVLALSNRQVLDKLNSSLKVQLFPTGDKCPKCGAVLTLKNSPKFGPFIGCTKYDESGCDYKSPPFLSKDDAEAHAKAKDALGINEETGKEIFLKPSRGGGFYVQSEDKEGNVVRQTLPKEEADILTLEEAKKWITLPREVGPHPETKEIIEAGFARSPFVRVKRPGKDTYQYANVPQDEDIFTLGMNRAVELLAGKNIQSAEDKELGLDPNSKCPVLLKTGRFGSYVETDELIRKTVPKDMSADEVTLEWAVSNLPIITYHPDDSRPVGIRRQRTRSKGWKIFVVHAGEKKELPKGMKANEVDETNALELIN